MSITSPAFILLALIGLLMALFAVPNKRAKDDAEKKLTAEDLKLFREQYLTKANRATMPTRFDDYARAGDKASRIWIISVLGIIAALVWIIMAGPNLGLFGE